MQEYKDYLSYILAKYNLKFSVEALDSEWFKYEIGEHRFLRLNLAPLSFEDLIEAVYVAGYKKAKIEKETK